MPELNERYFELLSRAVASGDVADALRASAELTRDMVKVKIPIEKNVEAQLQALVRLGAENPDLRLCDVAEVALAYHLAIRGQLRQAYADRQECPPCDYADRKLAEMRLLDLNLHLERRVMQRTAELDAKLLANIELAQSLARVNAQLTQEIEDRQYAQAEQRASQARMHVRETQSSRLEAIGTMAAGIAHDFNSILGVINGHAEMLGDDLPDHAPARQGLRQIIAASFRARDLIARMLAFAHQMPKDPGLVCVVAATRNALEMVRITLPFTVEMVFDTDLESAHLMADPFQIQQIVMNLCINAGDAMEGRGRLTVTLKRAPPARDAGSRVDRISLVVADNGCGMSTEVRSRVLEPFYTTKAPGEGSGLGLSVIYGIVVDLGGEIEIESTPGMGSQFRITLPLFDPARPAPEA